MFFLNTSWEVCVYIKNPLAELNQSIFDSANGLINKSINPKNSNKMSGYTFKQDLAWLYFPGRDKEVARRLFAREIHYQIRLSESAPLNKKKQRKTLMQGDSKAPCLMCVS